MKQIIAIGGGGFGRVIKDLKIEKYIKHKYFNIFRQNDEFRHLR